MTHTVTIEFSTMSNAINYAATAHHDAKIAVADAEAALRSAKAIEQDTAIVLSTLRKMREESS